MQCLSEAWTAAASDTRSLFLAGSPAIAELAFMPTKQVAASVAATASHCGLEGDAQQVASRIIALHATWQELVHND